MIAKGDKSALAGFLRSKGYEKLSYGFWVTQDQMKQIMAIVGANKNDLLRLEQEYLTLIANGKAPQQSLEHLVKDIDEVMDDLNAGSIRDAVRKLQGLRQFLEGK